MNILRVFSKKNDFNFKKIIFNLAHKKAEK